MKRLARVYAYYGKNDGEEVLDEILINDTLEIRKELFDDYSGYYNEDEKDFLAGESDSFYAENDGGDWDDPTSFQVVIYDKEELLAKAKSKYEQEVANIDKHFEKAGLGVRAYDF